MKQIFKRTILLCVACIMAMSVMLVSVSAEEGQAISINGTDTKFVELFTVENGIIYLPLRLAFNDFVDQGYSVVITPSMTKKNISISIVKVDSVTGEVVDKVRRGVYIGWNEEITQEADFANGRIEFYEYEKVNNLNKLLTFVRPVALSSALEFKKVDYNGGARTFISVEDLNTIVQFLIDDAAYSVKLK